MAWRTEKQPLAMAAPDPLQEEEGSPMNRRTLHRAFAAAVAIAAISPLFAADPNGCARGSVQNRSVSQTLPSQPSEHHRH